MSGQLLLKGWGRRQMVLY